LNNITGSGFGSVSQFLSNVRYRAWGTLKGETYGNGFTQSATYNTRLQMTSFEVRKPGGELQMSTTTQFYDDGLVKFSDNALDERFDRGFAYDHAARPMEAYSGSEARDFVNNTSSGAATGPYRQSYQFSPFNQITQQTNRLWSGTQTTTNIWSNNRLQSWGYDAAGFVIGDDSAAYTRDAAGRTVQADSEFSHAQYSFDGDGRLLKITQTRPGPNGGTMTTTSYYLNSTVLGRLAVAVLNGNAQRTTRYIYAGRRKLAQEAAGAVTWSHADPVTSSRGDSAENGVYHPLAEFNVDGVNVGFEPPVETGFEMPEPMVNGGLLALDSGCSVADPNCQTCYLDGFEHDCGR
ncbi:MAG: hypothetical protein L0Z53_22200, partial [Acidobacteriales bacterium]|nr:hypothetical protein [Terriglobales bacterium]